MTVERLWAGWRSAYVEGVAAGDDDGCPFCRILAGDEPPGLRQVVWRDDRAAALLNLFPYTNGHLLVMPVRHVADLEDLDDAEAAAVWRGVRASVRAIKAAYRPDGLNVGANLGRSAGAGVPGHFHLHVLPRWAGDTSFMTAVADVRVLPEALSDSAARLRAAWPPGEGPVDPPA